MKHPTVDDHLTQAASDSDAPFTEVKMEGMSRPEAWPGDGETGRRIKLPPHDTAETMRKVVLCGSECAPASA